MTATRQPGAYHELSASCRRLWRRRDGRLGGVLPRAARRRGHRGRAHGRGLRRVGEVGRLPGPRLVRRHAARSVGPRELRAPRRAGARARDRLRLPAHGHVHGGRARARAVGGGHRVEAPGWLDGAGVVTAALGSTETTAQVQPARFTTALLDAATTRGATLRLGVVEEIAQRDGAARGVRVGGETIEADAVVLAMGPWTSRAARGLRLPAVHGLKGYSVTLAGADVPAHALFVAYRTADGRALEPEIFPRPDGETYVCGMADPAPLPESAEGVEVNDASCEVLARAAGRVSTALAAAKIIRRQACYRPVTDDGLPLIGRIPGVAGAYVATGHGPWGMLNAPATGLALSELIADGAASLVDLRPFDPARRR